MDEWREKQSFKVRLKYDQEELVFLSYDKDPDREPRKWKRGEVVEVDLVGDPPGIMSVQDLVISGTDHFLDYDVYEILDEEKGDSES